MKLKRIAGMLRNWLLTRADPIESFRMRRMKRTGDLIDIEDLIPIFENETSFAFATGGSLSNIKDLERAAKHNVLMLTTAPVHCFRLFGLMPNLWLIHNSDSVRMTIKALDEYGLRGKLDFSDTYVLIPDNKSKSKVKFSSKSVRNLRSAIGAAKYTLYSERLYPGGESSADYASGRAVPDNYLEPGSEPIALMNGSSVEAVILPFLSYLGIREIYFGGVDHMDTGHFWDRNDPWQNRDGSPRMFNDSEIVVAAGEVALRIVKERGIRVYRLEETETILKHYPHLEFDKALQLATLRIRPKDIEEIAL